MNLKDFLVNSARLFPDKTAVIFREKRLTYGELYRDTCICGSALRNMGVKKGDSMGILSNIMNLCGVSSCWQTVLTGLILVVAILVRKD